MKVNNLEFSVSSKVVEGVIENVGKFYYNVDVDKDTCEIEFIEYDCYDLPTGLIDVVIQPQQVKELKIILTEFIESHEDWQEFISLQKQPAYMRRDNQDFGI